MYKIDLHSGFYIVYFIFKKLANFKRFHSPTCTTPYQIPQKNGQTLLYYTGCQIYLDDSLNSSLGGNGSQYPWTREMNMLSCLVMQNREKIMVIQKSGMVAKHGNFMLNYWTAFTDLHNYPALLKDDESNLYRDVEILFGLCP